MHAECARASGPGYYVIGLQLDVQDVPAGIVAVLYVLCTRE